MGSPYAVDELIVFLNAAKRARVTPTYDENKVTRKTVISWQCPYCSINCKCILGKTSFIYVCNGHKIYNYTETNLENFLCKKCKNICNRKLTLLIDVWVISGTDERYTKTGLLGWEIFKKLYNIDDGSNSLHKSLSRAS